MNFSDLFLHELNLLLDVGVRRLGFLVCCPHFIDLDSLLFNAIVLYDSRRIDVGDLSLDDFNLLHDFLVLDVHLVANCLNLNSKWQVHTRLRFHGAAHTLKLNDLSLNCFIHTF